jgi:hypothetical protein
VKHSPFAMVIAAQSGLPEYPSISLSHKTSLHKCCPGRAANSAGHGPTGMLANSCRAVHSAVGLEVTAK